MLNLTILDTLRQRQKHKKVTNRNNCNKNMKYKFLKKLQYNPEFRLLIIFAVVIKLIILITVLIL